jgi:hypothetical protein
MAVETLQKPAGRACAHLGAAGGCGIYPDRPQECRVFHCAWIRDPQLGEDWRPDRVNFLVRTDGDQRAIFIDVDPDHPEAWRQAPYYGRIKGWSRIVPAGQGRVVVYVGRQTWLVFPEGDLNVGETGPADVIVSGYSPGARPRPFARVTPPSGPERRYYLQDL